MPLRRFSRGISTDRRDLFLPAWARHALACDSGDKSNMATQDEMWQLNSNVTMYSVEPILQDWNGHHTTVVPQGRQEGRRNYEHNNAFIPHSKGM